MCGRYTDTKRDKEFLVRMGITAAEFDFIPRYNIAPTQEAWIAAQSEDRRADLKRARWGLIPSWAADEKTGKSLINARSETVATKPSFRSAYRKRRCLVLSDGFYEWQKTSSGKQPMCIRMREARPFAFGGLWERWCECDRQVESFCIITVEPNELCARIHNRMPLVLREEDFPAWLDSTTNLEHLSALLRPYCADQMECFPVSKLVNNARNDNCRCLEPMR